MQVPDEKIAALQTMLLDEGAFSPDEWVALELAERMVASGHAVDDGLWQRLTGHFDDGQIIELVSIAGLFNYFNRLNDALRMEITR